MNRKIELKIVTNETLKEFLKKSEEIENKKGDKNTIQNQSSQHRKGAHSLDSAELEHNSAPSKNFIATNNDEKLEIMSHRHTLQSYKDKSIRKDKDNEKKLTFKGVHFDNPNISSPENYSETKSLQVMGNRRNHSENESAHSSAFNVTGTDNINSVINFIATTISNTKPNSSERKKFMPNVLLGDSEKKQVNDLYKRPRVYRTEDIIHRLKNNLFVNPNVPSSLTLRFNEDGGSSAVERKKMFIEQFMNNSDKITVFKKPDLHTPNSIYEELLVLTNASQSSKNSFQDGIEHKDNQLSNNFQARTLPKGTSKLFSKSPDKSGSKKFSRSRFLEDSLSSSQEKSGSQPGSGSESEEHQRSDVEERRGTQDFKPTSVNVTGTDAINSVINFIATKIHNTEPNSSERKQFIPNVLLGDPGNRQVDDLYTRAQQSDVSVVEYDLKRALFENSSAPNSLTLRFKKEANSSAAERKTMFMQQYAENNPDKITFFKDTDGHRKLTPPKGKKEEEEEEINLFHCAVKGKLLTFTNKNLQDSEITTKDFQQHFHRAIEKYHDVTAKLDSQDPSPEDMKFRIMQTIKDEINKSPLDDKKCNKN